MRETHGLTLDQVAQAGRRYGATWSASSVRNLERGQASIPLPTLIHLALALGDLTGRPLTLSDLFGEAQAVSLDADDRIQVTRTWLDRMLAGQPLTITPDDIPWIAHDGDEPGSQLSVETQHTEGGISDALDELIEQSQIPPEPNWAQMDSRQTPSLAEKRAAEKLNIRPAELQQRAIQLWGRPLDEESTRRSGPGSSPQARGRVTRRLMDEIRDVLTKSEGGA